MIFISLSETDKRVIFVLLLFIIVTLVILGYIGLIITRVMKWQGKRMDQLTHDVVVTKVIDNKKDFMRYARKKNWVCFFKQAWIPLLIMLVAGLILIIRNAVSKDWSYDVFDYKVTGFGTLLFIFDFSDPDIYVNVFGMTLLAEWPPVISYPHWSWEAWCSYLFVPIMTVGGVWYLISLQCVIARTIRMHELKHSVFDKSLENYNQNNVVIPPSNNNLNQ